MISEKSFHCENLLDVTLPVVSNILGETFPELHKNLFNSLEIVKYEEELFKSLRDSESKALKEVFKQNPKLIDLNIFEYPGFIQAYQEFRRYLRTNQEVIDGEMIFQLYSTYGLDRDVIENLAKIHQMTLDIDGFKVKMDQMKKQHEISQNKEALARDRNFPPTRNDAKHDYSYDLTENLYKGKFN